VALPFSNTVDRTLERLRKAFIETARGAREVVGAPLRPDLPDEDIVQVVLDDEPDWLMLNQGSTVDVWIGQKRANFQYAVVQAIVASGKKWAILLRRKDFDPDILRNTTDKATLHLVGLPHKPPKP